MFWLPTVVAIGYGLVVFVFAATGVLFGDEGGSWGEVAGAVAGNFALVWVAVLVVSAIIRRLQKD